MGQAHWGGSASQGGCTTQQGWQVSLPSYGKAIGGLASLNQDLGPGAGQVLSSPEESETVNVLVLKSEQTSVQNCSKSPLVAEYSLYFMVF